MDYASRHGLLQDCVVAIHNAQWLAVADSCTKDLPSCGCFPEEQHMLAGDAEAQVNGSAQPDELALAVSRPPPKDTASANGGVLLSVSTVPNGTGPTVGTTSHNGHSGSTHHNGCLSKGCGAKALQPPRRDWRCIYAQASGRHDTVEGCDDERAVVAALRGVAPSCRPSLATLTRLIFRYAKSGHWQRGLAVFRSLRILSAEADLAIANAALWACERGGDADAAWQVYMHMLDVNISLDSISYKALIPVLAANDQWEACVKCQIAALKSCIYLDGATCMSMLLALKRAGKWRIAEAALFCTLPIPPFQQLAQELVEPTAENREDPLLWTLRALCHRRTSHPPSTPSEWQPSVQSSESWWFTNQPFQAGAGPPQDSSGRSLQRPSPQNLTADPLACACCNSLMLMYKEASPVQGSRSLSLLLAMSEAKKSDYALAPDVLSYNLAIQIQCKAGQLQKAQGLQQVLMQTGLQLTVSTFAPVMSVARKTCDHCAVLRIWNDLRGLGIVPDVTCCTAFIAAASQSGSADELEEAARLVIQLAESPRRVAQVVQEGDALLLALACRGEPSMAIAVLHTFAEAGLALQPGSVTDGVHHLAQRDALLQALLLQQAAVDAGYVFVHAPAALLQHGCHPAK